MPVKLLQQQVPTYYPTASATYDNPTAAAVRVPNTLQVLGLPDEHSLREFCETRFSNICDLATDRSQFSQVMANNLITLLQIPEEAGAGDKSSVVRELTNSLLGSVTREDLRLAQEAVVAITTMFGNGSGPHALTPLDRSQNNIGLSYHIAATSDGLMAHALEMKSDVGFFYADDANQQLAEGLAYFHDQAQILDPQGMGIGNSQHWGLNEIVTAAAFAAVAAEAGASQEQQTALLKVAGAVIPSGTAFTFSEHAAGIGKPGLGTTIERMLRCGDLPAHQGQAAPALIAMAYTLAICDTQRNNLAGLARPTDELIQKKAPQTYVLLKNCAANDPEGFGATFFQDNGKLSEVGLALCSKLTSTVDVFKEFPACSPATPKFEGGELNNPLSAQFNANSLTPEQRDRAIYQIIKNNGTFGSSDVAADIESFRKTFSHRVLDKIQSAPLLKDPKVTFGEAYKTIAARLQTEQIEGTELDSLIAEMSAMGGSVPPPETTLRA
jgi:hypothetical protein